MPTGETVIEEDDEVYFVADEKHIEQVTRELQKLEDRYKNIYIAGCGNIGKLLANKIFEEFNVKVIEKDQKRCEDAAEELDNILILNADAADKDFLSSEGIDDCDVFIAVTQDDATDCRCTVSGQARYGASTYRHREPLPLPAGWSKRFCLGERSSWSSSSRTREPGLRHRLPARPTPHSR